MMRSIFIGVSVLMFFAASMRSVIAADTAETIALKAGETAEFYNLFWVANCRSMLKGPITVEILEGPPDVTASIKAQKIVPHAQNCSRPVEGGVLLLTAAKTIKSKIQTKLILRIKYPTVDGERQKSHNIDLILLP